MNNNEALESQLSAMFDGELPASECELLARRLARDEVLKARWGRYAAIGAAMRQEPSAIVSGSLARRVSVLLADEPSLLVGAHTRDGLPAPGPLRKWWRPVVGVAGTVAAAVVAAVAVFALRTGSPVTPAGGAHESVTPEPTVAAISTPAAAATDVADHSYAGSAPVVAQGSIAPTMQLVDFLVAHSEFSMPFLQRTALSALVGSAPTMTVAPNATRAVRSDSVHDSSVDLGARHAAAAR